MVVDVADVRDIGAKDLQHLPQLEAGTRGIDCVSPKFGLGEPTCRGVFKVDVGSKVLVVGSGFTAGIGHGEQSDLMSAGSQQFHEFEEINLSAAEGEVVFVAEQDFHKWRSHFLGGCRQLDWVEL